MEPFVWSKVFDFSGTTVAKVLSFLFKVLVILGVPALVIWIVYVAVIKPHTNPIPTTTVQAGGTATTYNIKVGIGGCARFPVVPNKK
jgi:hypothetical protein